MFVTGAFGLAGASHVINSLVGQVPSAARKSRVPRKKKPAPAEGA
ncbi:MAG TPA: hypothetical protein VFH51_15860 [Myxococcota bacterium]|nr:hypothetical protein [Myxococcota bacterium]